MQGDLSPQAGTPPMTDPFPKPWLMWLCRLLACAFAAWDFYGCILRPEWSVEVVVGGQQYTMWFPFWLWESPVSPVDGGVVGEVRWGRNLSRFAMSALWVIFAWRCFVPPRPVVTRVLSEPSADRGT